MSASGSICHMMLHGNQGVTVLMQQHVMRGIKAHHHTQMVCQESVYDLNETRSSMAQCMQSNTRTAVKGMCNGMSSGA